jgi:transcriptional regulator with XRE-family HTH domain
VTKLDEIGHLGDDFEVPSDWPFRFAYAWSGSELKRLRVEANISLDQQAAAMGISVHGLRSLEGRRNITAALVDRYREALNRVEVIEEVIEVPLSTEPVDEVPPLVPVPSSARRGEFDE